MSLEQLEECEALEAILGPALSVRRAPDGQTSLLIEIKCVAAISRTARLTP